MSSQPSYVTDLLARPLLPLKPPKLTDSSNPPWSPTLKASIADAQLHPLIEVTLHIMNDDLFSAHFLLRKLQEDDWGKWLHGLLHAREGDLRNAKCWYRDVPPALLRLFYVQPTSRPDAGDSGASDTHVLASRALDRFSVALGKGAKEVRRDTDESGLVPEEGRAYSEAQIDKIGEEDREGMVEAARRQLWRELVALLEQLVGMYGWKEWDGTQAYTKDSQGMKEKGRVLGEGWRTF